jgi:hypothetical protein
VYIVPLPPIVGKVDKDTPDYLHMTICEKYKILALIDNSKETHLNPSFSTLNISLIMYATMLEFLNF